MIPLILSLIVLHVIDMSQDSTACIQPWLAVIVDYFDDVSHRFFFNL